MASAITVRELMSTDLVTLTATVTDGDGDTDTVTVSYDVNDRPNFAAETYVWMPVDQAQQAPGYESGYPIGLEVSDLDSTLTVVITGSCQPCSSHSTCGMPTSGNTRLLTPMIFESSR